MSREYGCDYSNNEENFGEIEKWIGLYEPHAVCMRIDIGGGLREHGPNMLGHLDTTTQREREAESNRAEWRRLTGYWTRPAPLRRPPPPPDGFFIRPPD
jgi:hypothetical protein